MGHVPDFIQKKCASTGNGKAAFFVFHGTGKGSLDVPEEF